MSVATPGVMTPREIVHELDKYIVGQDAAKRAVAIALRNRWRRMQLAESLRDEVTPKNILMIGPTGVGKTEIARRLAKLAGAPFIKVEATKFTEVGYVGRDVESIIRDLTDAAVKMLRHEQIEKVRAARRGRRRGSYPRCAAAGTARGGFCGHRTAQRLDGAPGISQTTCARASSNDKEVELELSATPVGVEIMAPPGMEEMTNQLQSMFSNLTSQRKRTVRLKVKDALRRTREEEALRLVNEEEHEGARDRQRRTDRHRFSRRDRQGRASRGETTGVDVSREGVQRDLLPLIEGCTVSTKYGMVKTDHILFIASGAFHLTKPSDLIPELQGRLADPRRAGRTDGRGFQAYSDRAERIAHRTVSGADEHRRRHDRVFRRRDRSHCRTRLSSQPSDREHRRATAAYGDGATAGGRFVRSDRTLRRQRHRSDRCGLRRCAAQRTRARSGPVALHPLTP